MRVDCLSIGCFSSSRPVAILGMATLLMIGCSSSLIQPAGASADEIDALKRRNIELQKRATVGEVEVARLEREIARLEAELARARQPVTIEAPPVETETISQIEAYREPEIEESDLEEPPIIETVPEPDPARPSTLSEAVTPRDTPITDVATSAEAQSLYDEGYTLFHQRSYDDAESRFQRYVELYPTTELADNALFWVGESRYARGDYSAALEAFSATVEQFPQGNKVADALFKAGRCLESLGELDQARTTYGEVDSRYPGTAASAQARERLEALR